MGSKDLGGALGESDPETPRLPQGERARLAMDLHDGVIQRLAVIGFDLERLISQLERGEVTTGIELARTLQTELTEEIGTLRDLMADLGSPSVEGGDLEVALRDSAARFEQWDAVETEVRIDLGRPLVPAVATVIYRVVQESLLNVAKHARAGRVALSLTSDDDGANLVIRDDGVGFDLEAVRHRPGTHLGLISMRRRVEEAGGSFWVSSTADSGASVQVRFGPDALSSS